MKYWIILTVVVVMIISCNKEDNGGDPSKKLIFESLISEKDSISPGETTKIIASAIGYNISYHWVASLGDILPTEYDSIVIYATSPCQIGTNKITCEVIDGNDESVIKSIYIVVE